MTNSTIDRGLEPAGVIGRDDGRERLAAQHELARAEPQHDQRVRRARGRDQRAVIDVLQVSALRARHDRAGLSLAQNCGVVGCGSGALARAGHVGAAGRDVQIVDDARDHVGVLDRCRDPMAVVDEEREAADDQHPARDERDLRDEAECGS